MLYYKDRQEFEEIKNQFDAKRVQDHIDRTRQQKVEIIANLNEYIDACTGQLEVIEWTEIKKYVHLKRGQDYRTNRIEYYVAVKHYPDGVDNPSRYEWADHQTSKTFTGREKKAAREYAEELAAFYKCPIREGGF